LRYFAPAGRDARLAKQCRLSRPDFDWLIDCPLDRVSYEAKFIAQGAVEGMGSWVRPQAINRHRAWMLGYAASR
jgi:hypothetical protein